MRRFRIVPWVALVFGCSALINPDTSRLGDEADGGQPTADGGQPTADGGPPTIDAGPGTEDAGGGGGSDAGSADAGPECPGGCSDGIDCTEDSCVAGTCRNVADDAACGAGQRCSLTAGCVDEGCTTNADCDDGVFCDGVESCDGGRCVEGVPPDCTDDAACTVDLCDPTLDRCVQRPDDTVCADTVDCTVDRCAPASTGADVRGCIASPDDTRCGGFCTVGATCDPSSGCSGGTPRDCRDGDFCTADSCDADLEMCVSVPRDEDGDGFPLEEFITTGGAIACGGTDCNDDDGAINPDATEVCDRVDNDCDGTVDEGCPPGTGDTCANALALTLDSSGSGSASGRLGRLTDDYETSVACGATGRGGRDAVYYVDVPSGTWDLEIDTFGSSTDTVLGVGVDCSPEGLALVCNDDADETASTDSRIWVHRLSVASGTTQRVFILVDGYSDADTGAYTLNVALTSAASDSCGGLTASPPLDITGGGTILGSQSSGFGTQRGSCQPLGATSGEAVFQLESTNDVVNVQVYSFDFTPDVYLRRERCTFGGEVGCDTGEDIGGIDGAFLDLTVSEGQRHYLFVDGGSGVYVAFYEPW